MLPVNSVSDARTALKLLAPRSDVQNLTASKAVAGANPVSIHSVGPVITDALLQIADMASRLGADGASVRYEAQLEGAAFEDKVMSWLSKVYQDDEGFQRAVANGTLKVERAVDVEELGFRSYIADLQKGGGHLGSVGAITVNQQYLNNLNASGGHHTVGTAEGQDYYVTW